MVQCVKCRVPLAAREAKWARRTSDGERVPFCPDCAVAMRQSRQRPAQTATSGQQAPPSTPALTLAETSSEYRPPAAANRPGAGNKVPIDGCLLLILFALGGGLLAGGLAVAISRFVYLIIAFPIGMGFVGGTITAVAVRLGKVRHPRLAMLAGIVTGLFIYGVYWAGDYLAFRSEARSFVVAEMEAEFGESDAAAAAELVDLVLEEETGSGGFLGYVLFSAQEGMDVGRVGNSATFNVGTTLTVIYWLVEVILIGLVAAGVAQEAAIRPFCTAHDRWYEPNELVGGVGPDLAETAMLALREGHYAALRQMLDPGAPAPGLALYTARCRDCLASDPVLTVRTLSLDSRKRVKTKDLLQQPLSQEHYETLAQGTTPAGASAVEPAV